MESLMHIFEYTTAQPKCMLQKEKEDIQITGLKLANLILTSMVVRYASNFPTSRYMWSTEA
jgi:hypothetical protein